MQWNGRLAGLWDEVFLRRVVRLHLQRLGYKRLEKLYRYWFRQPDRLTSLPVDLLVQIITFFAHWRDRDQIQGVNRKFWTALREPSSWPYMDLTDLGGPAAHPHCESIVRPGRVPNYLFFLSRAKGVRTHPDFLRDAPVPIALENIHMDYAGSSDGVRIPLAQRKLSLDWGGGNVWVETFQPSLHPRLEELCIQRGPVSEPFVLHWSSCDNLHTLCLRNCFINRNVRVDLPPRLEFFEFHCKHYSDTVLGSMFWNTTLTTPDDFLHNFFAPGFSQETRQHLQTLVLSVGFMAHDTNLSEPLPHLTALRFQAVCAATTIHLDDRKQFWVRRVDSWLYPVDPVEVYTVEAYLTQWTRTMWKSGCRPGFSLDESGFSLAEPTYRSDINPPTIRTVFSPGSFPLAQSVLDHGKTLTQLYMGLDPATVRLPIIASLFAALLRCPVLGSLTINIVPDHHTRTFVRLVSHIVHGLQRMVRQGALHTLCLMARTLTEDICGTARIAPCPKTPLSLFPLVRMYLSRCTARVELDCSCVERP